FEYVDSAELLEVLFFLSKREGSVPIEEVTAELRSTTHSIQKRLKYLIAIDLVKETNGKYQFSPKNDEKREMVAELYTVWEKSRHTVLSLVFSPLKKARDIAESFNFTKAKRDSGEPND